MIDWGIPSVIANPVAGRHAAAKTLSHARRLFGQMGIRDILVTRAAGDEETLVTSAIGRGVRSFIVLGGDGTCSKVANAILGSGLDCSLAVVPTGTGNDFAKTLGVAALSLEHAADVATRGVVARIDVGIIDGSYFLNSCGFGFDASVLDASNRVRLLKGNAVYIYSALRQLFTYVGVEVRAAGTAGVQGGRMLMITVSNGQFLGGAFRIAPRASVLDGRLDACLFADVNVLERVKLFAGALRGTHVGMVGVQSVGIQRLTLAFPSPPQMEVDGELRLAGGMSVEVRCVPRALTVVAARGALR